MKLLSGIVKHLKNGTFLCVTLHVLGLRVERKIKDHSIFCENLFNIWLGGYPVHAEMFPTVRNSPHLYLQPGVPDYL